MKQLNHSEIKNNRQQFPISIVCDAIRTPENIGMCFRVAEGFGVSKIYLHESSPTVENKMVKKTARNTIGQVSWEHYTDFELLINTLKSEGNTIIGIEITDKSIAIQDFNFTSHEKIVLLLGSERRGIQDVNLIDATIAIPMYGRNSSMNVVHSLSIALYEATKQLIQRNNVIPAKAGISK